MKAHSHAPGLLTKRMGEILAFFPGLVFRIPFYLKSFSSSSFKETSQILILAILGYPDVIYPAI